MQFIIHVTKRHVEGAGLDNEYYSRYEDCDEDVEIDVDKDEVYNDIVNLICKDYFRGLSIPKTELNERIEQFINDLDLWDTLVETYYERLVEMYEEAYNDE